MNCEKLINEVRNRKLLWDARTASYKDKKKVKDAWDEVGKALNCDGDSAKKKWRSLRNNYTQERNKMNKQLKLGSGASEIYTSKWRYFADMNFLRTTVAEVTGNSDSSLYEEIRTVEPRDVHAEKETREEDDSNFSLNIEINEDRNSQKSTEMFPQRSNRCNKTKVSREFELLQEKKDETKNDGDYHFLMSFLPHMRQLSQYENALFRLRMSQLLMETLENDNPSLRE